MKAHEAICLGIVLGLMGFLIFRPTPIRNTEKINWVGYPIISYDDEYKTKVGRLEMQIGFRSDGVVVWRNVKTN